MIKTDNRNNNNCSNKLIVRFVNRICFLRVFYMMRIQKFAAATQMLQRTLKESFFAPGIDAIHLQLSLRTQTHTL